MAHLSPELKEARLALCRRMATEGKTQKEAAEACGVGAAALANWLGGNGAADISRQLAKNGVDRVRAMHPPDPNSKRQQRLKKYAERAPIRQARWEKLLRDIENGK